ncbi:putative non-specific serine/threonine protein kinase [Helianthus debilis subsp. tardiflorus]
MITCLNLGSLAPEDPRISKGTVVWVANREIPITDKSGMLELSRQGNLLICSGDNTVIWSSNLTVSAMNDNLVVVQLLDTGNLVVWDRSTNNESVIWQSFDHPGNTFLPK